MCPLRGHYMEPATAKIKDLQNEQKNMRVDYNKHKVENKTKKGLC